MYTHWHSYKTSTCTYALNPIMKQSRYRLHIYYLIINFRGILFRKCTHLTMTLCSVFTRPTTYWRMIYALQCNSDKRRSPAVISRRKTKCWGNESGTKDSVPRALGYLSLKMDRARWYVLIIHTYIHIPVHIYICRLCLSLIGSTRPRSLWHPFRPSLFLGYL